MVKDSEQSSSNSSSYPPPLRSLAEADAASELRPPLVAAPATKRDIEDVSASSSFHEDSKSHSAAAAAPAASPSDAWQTLWSEEYQCFYYWNSLTGESSWYPPSSSTVADDRPAYQVGGQQAAIDSLFDKIDQVKSKLDSELGLPDSKPAAILPSPADKSCDTGKRKWQHDNDPAGSDQFQAHIVPPALYSAPPLYTAAANFNVCRGKRLQDDPAALDNEPSAELSEFERSRRQCNHYFDYDSYIDAVNQSREGSYSLPEQPRRLTKKQVAALREKKLKNKQAKRTKWLLE